MEKNSSFNCRFDILPRKYEVLRHIYDNMLQILNQIYREGSISLVELAMACRSIAILKTLVKHINKCYNSSPHLHIVSDINSDTFFNHLLSIESFLKVYRKRIENFQLREFGDYECAAYLNIQDSVYTSMGLFYFLEGNNQKNINDESIDLRKKANEYYYLATLSAHSLVWSRYKALCNMKLVLNQSQTIDNQHINDYEMFKKIYNNARNAFNVYYELYMNSLKDVTTNIIQEHFILPEDELPCRLESKYKISSGESIGKGSFGHVISVTHKTTNIEYACKTQLTTPLNIEKLWNLHVEIETYKHTDHPRVVKLHEVFYESDCVYLIEENCTGGNLNSKVLRHANNNLSIDETRRIIIDVIKSVRYMHKQNVIHGDIKLENFVISENNVKVIDFGWSRRQGGTIQPLSAGGTKLYMSPEVTRGELPTFQSDIWSLGILAYRILTSGSYPFKIEMQFIEPKEKFDDLENHDCVIFNIHLDEPIEFPQYLSIEAKDFISKLLRKNPEDRISLDDALRHQFLCQDSFDPTRSGFSESLTKRIETNIVQSDSISKIVQALQEFWNMTKFNKVLCKVLSNYISNTFKAVFSDLFDSIDENGNGSLSIEEIKNKMSAEMKAAVERNSELFQNDDIEFSYSDYIAAIMVKHVGITHEVLSAAFSHLENKGYIEQLQFLTDAEFSELLTAVDDNHDKKISFEEWFKFFIHSDKAPKCVIEYDSNNYIVKTNDQVEYNFKQSSMGSLK